MRLALLDRQKQVHSNCLSCDKYQQSSYNTSVCDSCPVFAELQEIGKKLLDDTRKKRKKGRVEQARRKEVDRYRDTLSYEQRKKLKLLLKEIEEEEHRFSFDLKKEDVFYILDNYESQDDHIMSDVLGIPKVSVRTIKRRILS